MAQWKFQGDEIFVALDNSGTYSHFSCKYEVLKKKVDVISGLERVVIKIYNQYRNPEIELAREELTEEIIINKLTKYGVSIFNAPDDQALVKEILMDTEGTAPIFFYHNKLGFETINDCEVFLAGRLYGSCSGQIGSSVHYSDQMQPKGTLNKYRKFLIREVCQHPKLALALILGVTAPVVHILKKNHIFYETLLWSFCGESSTGKTTMLLAMLSIFGNPHFLISNLNATENALSAQVAAQAGFPFVADEATACSIDFDSLIYSLSSGKGKRRCNGDGTLKSLVNFSGAAFFSSEQPILDRSSFQGGEEARVVEFELNWFDRDGNKANKFLEFFSNNYGVAIEPLANTMLNVDMQHKIIAKYKKFLKSIETTLVISDGIDARIAQRIAIIRTSGWLLQKAIKVDFHLADVDKLLKEVFLDKKSRISRTDPVEKLIQLFTEDFLQHRTQYGEMPKDGKFTRHKKFALSHTPSSMRGMVGAYLGKTCIWLPSNIFEEILNKQATIGSSTAKKKLCEMGYLQKFGKSYYHWTNFGITSCNAYCVFLPQNILPDIADVELDTAEQNTVAQRVETPHLTMSFVKLTAQNSALILSSELSSALKLTARSPCYIQIWAKNDFLLVGKKPAKNAIEINLIENNGVLICEGTEVISILNATGITLNRLQGILISDIEVRKGIAQIHVDNPLGQYVYDINPDHPYKLPVKVTPSKSKSHIKSLLDEDEDTEDEENIEVK